MPRSVPHPALLLAAMRLLAATTLLSTITLLVAAPGRAALAPTGDEFPINSHTASSQLDPDVSSNSIGDLLVVWSSFAQDGDGEGVFLRGDGILETQVNSTTANDQHRPAVAHITDTRYVVVWQSEGGQDGDGRGVYRRVFDFPATPVTNEFRVNQTTASNQYNPDVAVRPGGSGFVVTWESQNQDGDATGIYARSYATTGFALGGEFQVNTTTAGAQSFPAIATSPSGRGVITWESPDGSFSGIYAQVFDSSGAIGTEIAVNADTTSIQRRPDVSCDAAGNFVVVWESAGVGIMARRFHPNGTPDGGELTVAPGGAKTDPKVAHDPAGGFVVTWTRGSLSNGDADARCVDSSGALVGPVFQLNQFDTDQNHPVLAHRGGGAFVFVWASEGQDGSSYGIIGRDYAPSSVSVDEPLLPGGSLTHLAAPSVFRHATTIRFELPASTPVTLDVFDTAGRRVRRLEPGRARSAGTHRVHWDGRNDAGRPVAPGAYFYRIRTSGPDGSGRIVRVR